MTQMKTHCKRGHEFSEESTYQNADGHRECLPCKRMLRKRHHDRAKAVTEQLPVEIPAWIWAKVDKTDSCWLWRGYIEDGYGKLTIKDKNHWVHRLFYAVLVGPINAETLDHLCCDRACVNPKHLEPVSLIENSRRERFRNAKVV